MTLKAWREIARPHKDVLEGTFKQSEFAADISQVASGNASPEYQDAKKFFSRTFITEGMRLLLISVIQRLAGQGGDPVIQLQTAFGGGKTHTMLAVYHLATYRESLDELYGIPPVLDEANIPSFLGAKVAVIDGIKLSPSHPQKHGDITANTLWGELAWQLLGDTGYAMVADSDMDGTSPGKDLIRKVIQEASPCVILMDELLAFIRQLEFGQHFKAGSFDSNLSFIQALTEAIKLVPDAILLASLPDSDLEIGGRMGKHTLNALEKYFARVESVWKPVASTESFEIVRRRLFENAGDPDKINAICRQFFDFYRDNSNKFPMETRTNDYFELLCHSYPIHPEIFDRLYEDWSTLDKFQRTRGVLQYMAIVIHRLWNNDNTDALIMPGSIDLEDTNVRNKSIHYLPQGWEPVIEKEVDGTRSEPFEIDGHDTRFGAVQAARRAMRTIFLGSAPKALNQKINGLLTERILLGCAQPGQTIGVYEDVLKRLRDKLQYLYSDDNRFWLDTKPNLRREMENRKNQIKFHEQVIPFQKTRIRKMIGNAHCFSGIHIFTSSGDVPDDYGSGPRLIILPPGMSSCYRKEDPDLTFRAAEKILRYRGDQPRQKQNRLLFLAADADLYARLNDYARSYIAWEEILSDIDNGKLNLDLFQINQAKKQKDIINKSLIQLIKETYKWLICPVEDIISKKNQLAWEVVSISSSTNNIITEIEQRIKEEEWLISEWSPIHLQNILRRWYFKDGISEVSALKVWQDTCHYLYLPRLQNEQVFKNVIEKGIKTEDYFGFAAGKNDKAYLDFVFGKKASIILDNKALFIQQEKALDYKKKTQSKKDEKDKKNPGDDNETPPIDKPGEGAVDPPTPTTLKTQFYGSINLDPVKAKLSFAEIVDEVVQQFTSKLNIEVRIAVEIVAQAPEGFDESLQRAIKENCSVLNFNSAEFESE